MRILAIGDIHGKTVWRQLIDKVPADVIVFVGDFIILDHWLFNKRFRSNLGEIIRYKRENFNKVRLLVGNHDKPFIYRELTRYKVASPRMWKLYHDSRDCFEVAFQHQEYLFTHAGVTGGWYAKHRAQLETYPGTLADKLNAIHRSADYLILQERGKARGGDLDFGGILYADKSETEAGALSGYTQIVGHTKVQQPMRLKRDDAAMVYIDCLNAESSCLYIDEAGMHVVPLSGAPRILPTYGGSR